jgi:DNA repair exonuclease SbcCD ATPase subunit
MAEPVHRKVPVGATTAASIREFELSPLQMVKEICLFYVKKCSGKYEDNKAAARYVHQMAEEIITQLSGVAGEIKRNKGEPELYQALLDEWNENFPSSLGAMGSPKSIAALVSSQSTEIGDLRSALEIERTRREKDVSEITRSMDAQLQAYKSSVMSERRHQQLLEQQQRENYETDIQQLREKYQQDLEKMASKQVKETRKNSADYETRIQEAQSKVAELQSEVEHLKKAHAAELAAVSRSRDKQHKKLEDKYNKLKAKYLETVAAFNEENPTFGE